MAKEEEKCFEHRLDVQKTLLEVGELNIFFEGMKEAVSFLALLNGLKKVVSASKRSIFIKKRLSGFNYADKIYLKLKFYFPTFVE